MHFPEYCLSQGPEPELHNNIHEKTLEASKWSLFKYPTNQCLYRMHKFEHNPTFTPVFTALGAAAGGGGESCSLHVSILHSSPPLSAQLPPSSHLQSLTPLTSRYLGQLFSFCKTCLFFADTMCKPSVPPAKVGCEMWYRLSVQQICDCSVECGVKISNTYYLEDFVGKSVFFITEEAWNVLLCCHNSSIQCVSVNVYTDSRSQTPDPELRRWRQRARLQLQASRTFPPGPGHIHPKPELQLCRQICSWYSFILHKCRNIRAGNEISWHFLVIRRGQYFEKLFIDRRNPNIVKTFMQLKRM